MRSTQKKKKRSGIFLEIVAIAVQLFIFYYIPNKLIKINELEVKVLMFVSTFYVGLFLGALSDNRNKIFLLIINPLLFIPAAFMYFDAAALLNIIWLFLLMFVGMTLGLFIHKLKGMGKKKYARRAI